MATIKSYTDLEQSKKLAEILPLESADMVLPFRHTKKDEYIPGYVVSRNYVEVYNEMIKLPGMEKEDACKLIQPCWSLVALLGVLKYPSLTQDVENKWSITDWTGAYPKSEHDFDNPVDACMDIIIKLKERNII